MGKKTDFSLQSKHRTKENAQEMANSIRRHTKRGSGIHVRVRKIDEGYGVYLKDPRSWKERLKRKGWKVAAKSTVRKK